MIVEPCSTPSRSVVLWRRAAIARSPIRKAASATFPLALAIHTSWPSSSYTAQLFFEGGERRGIVLSHGREPDEVPHARPPAHRKVALERAAGRGLGGPAITGSVLQVASGAVNAGVVPVGYRTDLVTKPLGLGDGGLGAGEISEPQLQIGQPVEHGDPARGRSGESPRIARQLGCTLTVAPAGVVVLAYRRRELLGAFDVVVTEHGHDGAKVVELDAHEPDPPSIERSPGPSRFEKPGREA